MMEINEFGEKVNKIIQEIAGKPIERSLATHLNTKFPPESEIFQQISSLCSRGIDEGWLCNNEAGGIRYGRAIKDLQGFSVDVVLMDNIIGPYHTHPRGEVDMIIPLSLKAKFDGHSAGWLVYGPGTGHKPTVSEGKAIILYLLPEGKISFS
tara:strand:+ start:805 stop:1260 length:456 start_codon:yes stop_codon:yes gene_type:complete